MTEEIVGEEDQILVYYARPSFNEPENAKIT
jgi:hypothetical protein